IDITVHCLSHAGIVGSLDLPEATGGPIFGFGTTQRIGAISVFCPTGTHVVGGGFSYTGTQGVGNPYRLHALPQGWEIALYGASDFVGLSAITPHIAALCVKFT